MRTFASFPQLCWQNCMHLPISDVSLDITVVKVADMSMKSITCCDVSQTLKSVKSGLFFAFKYALVES